MTNVIKRRGNIEAFSPDKIKRSIQKAALDAKYSLKDKEELIDEVSEHVIEKYKGESEVKTEVIREDILREMMVSSPEICEAWRKFDRRYKF